MSMYAFISKNIGGVRIGIGQRIGLTRRACNNCWCRYRVRILTLGSGTIIVATMVPPRAGIAFIVFAVVAAIGFLVTRDRPPKPVVTDERMDVALHPHHGEKP